MLNPLPVNPAQIILKFPTRTCGFDPANLAPPVYTLTQATMLPGVAIGTQEFSDTALALFTPSTSTTTPTNNSILQSLIQQFSNDYLLWRQTQFDIVLAGIAAVHQNALYDITEFDYNQEICLTRIKTYSGSYTFARLAHQIMTLDSDCPNTAELNTAEPCAKLFGPPIEQQSSGSIVLDEYLLCFQDGRLTETWLQKVTYPCGCGPPSQDCCFTMCGQCSIYIGNQPSLSITINFSNSQPGSIPVPPSMFSLSYVGGNQWTSLCVDLPGGWNGGPSGNLPSIWTMTCNGSQVTLVVSYYNESHDGSCDVLSGNFPFGIQLIGGLNCFNLTQSCNPNIFTWNYNSVTCGDNTASSIQSVVITAPNTPSGSRCCINICIPNCEIATYTVTIVGVAVGVITTTADGGFTETCITLDIGTPGTYPIEVTGSNGINFSQSYNLHCCQVVLIPIYCASFSADGCNDLPAPDAIISIGGNTYDLPAYICLDASKEPFDYTISAPLFQDFNGTFSFNPETPCDDGRFATLTPISGYYCLCVSSACPYPAAGWTLTDSQYGAVAMIFDGLLNWTGFSTGNYPGGPSQCGGGGGCDPIMVSLRYQVSCQPGGSVILSVSYESQGGFNTCPTGGNNFNTTCNIGVVNIETCPEEYTFEVDGMGFPCGSCVLYPDGATFVMTSP